MTCLDIYRNQYNVENVKNISDHVNKVVKKMNFIKAFSLSKMVKTFPKFLLF